ncbi:hypothetical protein Anas_06155 [Armadillidium nasatum]|uniref:Glutathione peroxidase n=1 Tax=Armadillidium nasatum TaxID=96803 RepID=A0A5N5SU14_9CRUS|nr:hypothetical protein Anas_06155 [Armadillidium nasatum]
MKEMLSLSLIIGIILSPMLSYSLEYLRVECHPGSEDIYGFNATLLDESRVVQFDEFRGKVLLIYNVATY